MVLSPGSAEAPAGYPYKNSNNRKNRKHAGETKRPLGRREGMVGYLTCSSVEGFGGWRGVGTQQMFIRGGSAGLRSLLYTTFARKGSPFQIPLLQLTNGTPFTYLVYDFVSFLIALFFK